MDMKATGIVRRVDQCVIIGQTAKSRVLSGVSLILSIFHHRKFDLIFLLIQIEEVHKKRFSWCSITPQFHINNFPNNLPHRFEIPDGFCHTVRYSFVSGSNVVSIP